MTRTAMNENQFIDDEHDEGHNEEGNEGEERDDDEETDKDEEETIE